MTIQAYRLSVTYCKSCGKRPATWELYLSPELYIRACDTCGLEFKERLELLKFRAEGKD